MKSGLSIVDLAKKITATRDTRRDFVLCAKNLRMTPGGEIALTAGDEGIMLPTTDVFASQLATYCHVPKPYYDRCPYDLRSQNINHWLTQAGDDRRQVRTADGHARAFLSDKYRPLDNYDLAEHVLPLLAMEGMRVESADVTDSRFYIKAVNEKVGTSKEDRLGVIYAAVLIQNSEVGHGSLSITPMTYVLKCKNGAIHTQMAKRKYHAGERRAVNADFDTALEVYCDATKQKMDSALWAQVADLVNAATSEAQFMQITAKMREATEGKQISGLVETVELLRKSSDLSMDESAGVLKHLAAGGDLSRWGLLNAVTRAAQDVESYDRSTDLERMGHAILEMNAREWAEIAV